MNLLGLVKDSFEAVVQEVESACHRDSETAPRNGSSQHANHNNEDTVDDNVAETTNPPEPWSASTAIADCEEETPSEPMSLPGQLQLLADVLQQASFQLSAATEQQPVDSTGAEDAVEADEEPLPDPFEELQNGQTELRKLFESRLRSDDVQSRTLERLHQELQSSRSQIQRKELEPLLKDIIFCHDFVTRELGRDESDDSAATWRQAFEVLGQMLLDVLFKYDVEPFRSESDEFDRKSQQCVRTEQASGPEQDKQIATYGLTGFRNEDRIIRREQVTVYRYRPSG